MPEIRLHSALSPPRSALLAALILLIASSAGIRTSLSSESGSDLQANEQQAEDILRELVEFESTGDKPEETKLALQAMATRLVNAGFPEASFAGALQVRMGGPNVYHGKLVEKPYIGGEFTEPGPEKIQQTCELMMLSALVAAFCGGLLLYLLQG